jgi:hypothetical protein
VIAGGATATPTGAGQAAAGAMPVHGGGGAIDPKLIAALEELIKVLAALVEQLKAGVAGGGPTKGGGHGMPPGKVGGVDGGGIVQQSPLQIPMKPIQGGGGTLPPPTPMTPTPTPAPAAQPTAPAAAHVDTPGMAHGH